jgi:NTP pyrophosphatase (non-canonical NTP hydrolase)
VIEFIKIVQRTIVPSLVNGSPERRLMHAIAGLSSELGELRQAFRSGSPEQVYREAADVMWFLAELWLLLPGDGLSESWDEKTLDEAQAEFFAAVQKYARGDERYPDLSIAKSRLRPLIGAVCRLAVPPELAPPERFLLSVLNEKLSARLAAGTIQGDGDVERR